MARGVDVDAICISPEIELEPLLRAIVGHCEAAGYTALNSIDNLLLDPLQEWLIPGERCVANAQPPGDSGWRMLYDTQFSSGALADALAGDFPNATLVQINLQEEIDLTLRVLRDGAAVFEYSNSPSVFNWGRCLGKTEAARIERPDATALAAALGMRTNIERIESCLTTIAARGRGTGFQPAKETGQDARPTGPHHGGCHDALQDLAAEIGLPRVYRFFQGWMRSDLDWDEDGVVDVLAFRKTE